MGNSYQTDGAIGSRLNVKIKICCIESLDEARLAIDAGADVLGLVGDMPSGPGVISDQDIKEIASKVSPPVSTFTLTSETTAERIKAHIDFTQTTAVQIVSHIDPHESKKLAEILPNVTRVQVIHVEGESAINLIGVYSDYVDYFLLDSGRPNADIAELGGTGRTHNWDISRKFVEMSPVPVFLAGGLNSENVRDAIQCVNPYGVDLCSGVRTNGKLDPEKLRLFMKAVRQ